MKQAVYIVDAWRTPFCRSGSEMAALTAQDLAVQTLAPALQRVPEMPGLADVLMGNVLSGRGNLARYGLLGAGFPVSVPGSTVDRQCASGLDTVAQAFWRAAATEEPVSFVAGGVESMSTAPYPMARATRAYDRTPPKFLDIPLSPPSIGDPSMIDTAETVSAEAGISREDMDHFALSSHRKALAAMSEGRFAREIVPIRICGARGQEISMDEDVGPRADTDLEKLSRLAPVVAGGCVSAGNASGIADGAAAVVVMNEAAVKYASLAPLARICSTACVGVDPLRMGLGPVPAVQLLLKQEGVPLSSIGWWEINEAFAGQVLAVARALNLAPEQINADGGAIALGHPLGASGARIAGHLAHCLVSQLSGSKGIAALCVGGGMGMAVLMETP